MNLVGQNNGEKKVLPSCLGRFRDGEARSDIIAGVCGLLGQVGVVIVEVSYHYPVNKRREIWSGLPSGPEEC